ncbi:hypothetical protein ACH4SP_02935 [Streptomyces sp. NPDC021093]|uniref:hypothetical protein n=1 Tax=Streptomyces sp. NPDC021093 TaxID=3365112 RepID=UPI00378FB63F
MNDTTDTAPLSEAQARYEEARVAGVALDRALRDAGAEATLVNLDADGFAVSMILRIHRSTGLEPGLLRGSTATTEEHAVSLTAALAENGVRCTVDVLDVREPTSGLLRLNLPTSEDADVLTRWVVAGLDPGRATARRLRRAFAAIETRVRPHARYGRIEIGSLDPTDSAHFSRALGGMPAVDPDGMADMDPDELEALAAKVAARIRRTTKVRVVVDPEPGCAHEANRLHLGSVTDMEAHRLAAYLESRTDMTGEAR